MYKQGNLKNKWSEDNWVGYKPEDIEKYSKLPDKTIEYYKECFNEGRNPLLWHMVPHILYKGPINIKDAKVLRFY